nr:C-type lectin domain family 4 member K-like [Misgurnus anguillicaudatus]
MAQIRLEKLSVCEDITDLGTSNESVNKNDGKLHNQGCNRTWNRRYRFGAQFLGLLCAVLLTAIIILYFENKRLQSSRNDLTEQKTEYLHHTNEHQVRYKNLSLEKEQLENSFHQFQVRHNSMVEKNDLFRAITANLTKEKIQLQTLNSNLVKEKDRFQILSNKLAREINQSETSYKAMADQRDKIQNWYNNMTDGKNRLQILNSNLVEERRKLQSQNDNLTKERNQIHLEMGGLQKALSNFGWKYFKSSLYSISTVNMNWTAGRLHCNKSGADLVVINSKEEMIFVHSLISDMGAWLGLTDAENEGVWKWVDGKDLTTSYWVRGQPDNGGIHGNEDCGATAFDAPALQSWHDCPCDYISFVICEKSV